LSSEHDVILRQAARASHAVSCPGETEKPEQQNGYDQQFVTYQPMRLMTDHLLE
jgi:hypothetical protein